MNQENKMSSFLSRFTRSLLAANPAMAAGFQQWSWRPGMGFQDTGLWWGEEKKRITRHEGVDLVRYCDKSGTLCNLTGPLHVPTIFSGELVWFHRDFLAWSLYIRHPQFAHAGFVLHTVFGHMMPGEKASAGWSIAAGEPVGTLDKYQINNIVPLHLHLTLAWIAEVVAFQEMSWQLLNNRNLVTLVDPRSDCSLL